MGGGKGVREWVGVGCCLKRNIGGTEKEKGREKKRKGKYRGKHYRKGKNI